MKRTAALLVLVLLASVASALAQRRGGFGGGGFGGRNRREAIVPNTPIAAPATRANRYGRRVPPSASAASSTQMPSTMNSGK